MTPATRHPRAWLWPAIIVVSSAAIAILTYAGVESPVRVAFAFWFLLVCPGMALVRLLRLKDVIVELTLAVALSLALDALVASALVYTGLWSSKSSLAILIAISIAGAAAQLKRAMDDGRWTMEETH